MAGKWLRARQTKYAAYATVYIVVVLTIAVVANVLANRYNRSWDSTANKRFTLSDQTAKVVGDLPQDALIKYYDQTGSFQQARDLLDRYANLSSGFASSTLMRSGIPRRFALPASPITAPPSSRLATRRNRPRA